MRHERLRPALTTVALTLLATQAGAAQTIPSPYRFIEDGQSVGLFVGYMDAGVGRFDLGPKSAPAVGGRWSVRLSNFIGLETTASVLSTQRDVINPTLSEGSRSIGEADTNLTFIDARLRFNLTGQRTWHGIQPFLTAGGGFAFDTGDGSEVEADIPEDSRFDFGVEFGGVFGAGARVFLTDNLALRGEAELLLYQIETPEGWLQNEELEIDNLLESEWASSGLFKIGLSFLY